MEQEETRYNFVKDIKHRNSQIDLKNGVEPFFSFVPPFVKKPSWVTFERGTLTYHKLNLKQVVKPDDACVLAVTATEK